MKSATVPDMPKTLAFPVTPNIGATANLVHTLEAAGHDSSDWISTLLDRHFCGDWGDLCDEDKQMNAEALRDGDRILSRYNVDGLAVYVITDAACEDEHGTCKRWTTTIMLIEDY